MSSSVPEDPFRDGLPTLEDGAGRVRLRALRMEDRHEIYLLYCDKDAVRFGYAPKMEDLDDAARLVEHVHEVAAKKTIFHWGVASTADDRVVGHATLFDLEMAHRRAEVGYSVRRDLWGRGLGTEAVDILVRFGFERLGLRRLEADVDPRNSGSLRLLEKLGFVREGYMRQRWELAGEIQDTVFFGLLRHEYRLKAPSRGADETGG